MSSLAQTEDTGGRRTSLLVRVATVYVAVVEWLAILAMIALVTVAGLQVFFRYVMNDSLFWSEELMRYLMIWTAFLTSGIVYSRGGFLGMRVLVDAAPPRVGRAMDIVGRLAILLFLVVVAWYGVEFAARTSASQAVALQFSMVWVHGAVPFGCILIILHVVAQLFLPASPAGRDDLPQAI